MPPREGGTLEVCSDGACADQEEDPRSARVAWAFHIPGPRGGSWTGPVAGHQSAQRGELSAAVAIARATLQPVLVWIDSRYVRDGVARIAGG
eukprot:1765438-Lingulodinium_polyedra.AAC.1